MDAPNRPEWLPEVQRAVASIPPSATAPAPLLFDVEHLPITTALAWQARREMLLRQWRAFLGSIEGPRRSNKIEVLEEDRREDVIRQLVRYESETDLPVEGYLLRPLEPGRGRPGVVVLHSTVDYTVRQPAGLEGPSDKHVGLHLARRGYVTSARDASSGNTPNQSGWRQPSPGCTVAIPASRGWPRCSSTLAERSISSRISRT